MAWQDSALDFTGVFPSLTGGAPFLTQSHAHPTLFTAWTEFRHQLTQGLDLTLGVQGTNESHSPGVLRPKFGAKYRTRDGSTLALLAYPVFDPDRADLLPVETWAQPFEVGGLNQLAGGSIMNFELSVEHPVPAASLLSGVAFYRRLRDVLIPTVEPSLAPVVTRLPVRRGEIWGAHLAYQHAVGPELSSQLFVRYTASRDDDLHRELPYFPRWQGGMEWDYVNIAGVAAQVSTTYVGRRRDVQTLGDAGTRLGGFVTTDLRLKLAAELESESLPGTERPVRSASFLLLWVSHGGEDSPVRDRLPVLRNPVARAGAYPPSC